MQTNSTSELSCSVFGHNLVKIPDDTLHLRCKTCDSTIEMEQEGRFEKFPIQNHKLRHVLQHLFLLENGLGHDLLTY